MGHRYGDDGNYLCIQVGSFVSISQKDPGFWVTKARIVTAQLRTAGFEAANDQTHRRTVHWRLKTSCVRASRCNETNLYLGMNANGSKSFNRFKTFGPVRSSLANAPNALPPQRSVMAVVARIV